MSMKSEIAKDDTKHAPDLSPRIEARRQTMIDAAAAVFFEQGFERTALAAIVRRSGGSLSTLYQIFGNKEGLFEAMVTQRCGEILIPFGAADMDVCCIRETLTGLAHALLGVILDQEAMGLWRMVIGEGVKFPRLPEIYFRCGPDKLLAALSGYLAVQHEKGRLYCPDAPWAAQSFVMLAHGEMFYRVVTGVRPPPDAAELNAHIEQTVTMFLRMTAPAGS
jgi:AcrR family transcriptional regulator